MTVAGDVPSIVERFPVEEWGASIPHEFSPKRETAPDAICTACGAKQDRAIHSATFWKAQRGVDPLPSATDYLEWEKWVYEWEPTIPKTKGRGR
jgi:hypothetical protein